MSAILSQKLTIIGTGNVASSLVHALKSQDAAINEIYSRNLHQAKQLSEAIQDTTPSNSLDFSKSDSTIFIIAVTDDAIAEVVREIKLPKSALLFHTSGTVPIEILGSNNGGIFYPLQTFTKEKLVDFIEVPILIEGTDSHALEVLKKLGGLISNQVKIASGEERKKLHIAAVFASNFTNRMLASAQDILQDTSLSLEILRPLVMESVRNVFDSNPDEALSGPAKRGDHKTIIKHIKTLETTPELQVIYEAITALITRKNQKP